MFKCFHNSLYVIGRNVQVEQFVNAFLDDPLNAHVPVDSNVDLFDAWGCQGVFPELFFKTTSTFGARVSCHPELWRTASVVIPQVLTFFVSDGPIDHDVIDGFKETCEGFEGVRAEDHVILLTFKTLWGPPDIWIESVINRYWEHGLRFFLTCRDSEGWYNSVPVVFEFWSVSEPQTEVYVMGHCAKRESYASDANDGSDEPASDFQGGRPLRQYVSLHGGFTAHVLIAPDTEPKEPGPGLFGAMTWREPWRTRFMCPGVTLSLQTSTVVVSIPSTLNAWRDGARGYRKLTRMLKTTSAAVLVARGSFISCVT
jgi:hypothetical protein